MLWSSNKKHVYGMHNELQRSMDACDFLVVVFTVL